MDDGRGMPPFENSEFSLCKLASFAPTGLKPFLKKRSLFSLTATPGV
jgi:hypothetical protein